VTVRLHGAKSWQLPRIGKPTAAAILTAIGDIGQYTNGKQLVKLASLDIRLFESGSSIRGTRLRRDNEVSVRYAEELNSAMSSVTLQSTDRHGILGQKPTPFQLSL
jgi:transposase